MPRRVQSFTITSELGGSREDVWRAVTSFDGIAAEMGPWLRMSAPRGVRAIGDVEIRPGERLFRSWILLFGVVPIDFSELTLVSIEEGRGFVEESPMGTMRRWRHERTLEDGQSSELTIVTDRLTFEPRAFGSIVGAIVRRFFAHRHAMLRRRFPRPA